MMDRRLIDYLPRVVRDYDVFKGITEGEQPEFEHVWTSTDELLENQFVTTAGDLGLSRWEKIFGISPKGTDTLEDRRFRVLTRINEELPYTLPQLEVILETLCGEGNFSVQIEKGSYILTVRIALVAKNNFEDVQSLMERVTPENLVVTVSLLYNRYAQFEGMTYGELTAYTYGQLRSEVFE